MLNLLERPLGNNRENLLNKILMMLMLLLQELLKIVLKIKWKLFEKEKIC